MTEGLITRIGRWMDRKWEAKVTWSELQDQESKCSQRHCGALEAISERATKEELAEVGKALADTIKQVATLQDSVKELAKALKLSQEASRDDKPMADLEKRMQQLELYVGMKRQVDPTKAPVAKSAFSM